MIYYLAIFSSITYANKIKKILDKQKGFTILMHTPSSISPNGCSYCLRFKEDKLNEVINRAKETNTKILNIYKEEQGKYFLIK